MVHYTEHPFLSPNVGSIVPMTFLGTAVVVVINDDEVVMLVYTPVLGQYHTSYCSLVSVVVDQCRLVTKMIPLYSDPHPFSGVSLQNYFLCNFGLFLLL
jgi:hypothetical protein